MLMPVIGEALEQRRHDEATTSASPCSGSLRLPRRPGVHLRDRPSTASARGRRSRSRHVEMDGAWALYEAWVRLQPATSTPRSSTATASRRPATCAEVLTRQLDPYYVAPLWPDAVVARRAAGAGAARRRQGHRARTWPRSRPAAAQAALDNPHAQLTWDSRRRRRCWPSRLLVDPLRKHDCPPITDGAAAVVLAAGDRARELCERPGVDPRHRPPHRAARARRCATSPTSPSTALAGREGRRRRRPGRRRRAARAVQPPGADPARGARPRRRRRRQPVGRRAGRQPDHGRRPHPHRRGRRPHHRRARPTAASPTRRRGPCLQQNLVCVLEGES